MDLKPFIQRTFNFNFQGMPWMLLFTMLLTTLKCLGKFDYSWWIVTAPLWGPFAIGVGTILAVLVIVLAIAVLAAAGVGIAEACGGMRRKWKQRRDRIAREKLEKLMRQIPKDLQRGSK